MSPGGGDGASELVVVEKETANRCSVVLVDLTLGDFRKRPRHTAMTRINELEHAIRSARRIHSKEIGDGCAQIIIVAHPEFLKRSEDGEIRNLNQGIIINADRNELGGTTKTSSGIDDQRRPVGEAIFRERQRFEFLKTVVGNGTSKIIIHQVEARQSRIASKKIGGDRACEMIVLEAKTSEFGVVELVWEGTNQRTSIINIERTEISQAREPAPIKIRTATR